jgi:multiple sugar transport system permease protein
VISVKLRISERRFGFLLLIPSILYLSVLLVYPAAYSLNLSFHLVKLTQPELGTPFIGLANYVQLLHDEYFLAAIRNTIVFTALSVALEFLLGLTVALALDKIVRGQSLVRSLILMPLVLAPVVTGTLWKWMYSPEFGVINYLLGSLGIPGPGWLSNPSVALFSVIIADSWNMTVFIMIVLFAGLQSLPAEPFEAAKIDGASPARTFWHITLPLLKPTILFALLIRFMDAFRVFDIIYMLTLGGPGTSTESVSTIAYKIGFSFFDMGTAAAASWFITIVITLMCLILVRLLWTEIEV